MRRNNAAVASSREMKLSNGDVLNRDIEGNAFVVAPQEADTERFQWSKLDADALSAIQKAFDVNGDWHRTKGTGTGWSADYCYSIINEKNEDANGVYVEYMEAYDSYENSWKSLRVFMNNARLEKAVIRFKVCNENILLNCEGLVSEGMSVYDILDLVQKTYPQSYIFGQYDECVNVILSANEGAVVNHVPYNKTIIDASGATDPKIRNKFATERMRVIKKHNDRLLRNAINTDRLSWDTDERNAEREFILSAIKFSGISVRSFMMLDKKQQDDILFAYGDYIDQKNQREFWSSIDNDPSYRTNDRKAESKSTTFDKSASISEGLGEKFMRLIHKDDGKYHMSDEEFQEYVKRKAEEDRDRKAHEEMDLKDAKEINDLLTATIYRRNVIEDAKVFYDSYYANEGSGPDLKLYVRLECSYKNPKWNKQNYKTEPADFQYIFDTYIHISFKKQEYIKNDDELSINNINATTIKHWGYSKYTYYDDENGYRDHFDHERGRIDCPLYELPFINELQADYYYNNNAPKGKAIISALNNDLRDICQVIYLYNAKKSKFNIPRFRNYLTGKEEDRPAYL